jgi:glycosyltransferase involved in cell wall biosynthesis
MVTALAPYKRVDQALAAFAALGRPLRVIGSGQQLERLRRSAPPNVQLLGWRSDQVVREHYRRCRAVVFPGEEDFGLVPLEAMACGAPVIAFAAGGALETVLDQADPRGPTGVLYRPGTTEGLVEAVRQFEHMDGRFDPQHLARWAGQFSQQRFLDEFRGAVAPLLAARGLPSPW